MSLPQIKHTDTGLSDTATDRKWQFIIQNSPLEIHFRTFLTATNLQLMLQSSCIHTDTHGRKLQSDIQNRIINDDITVQLPVIIVRCTTVVWFAGCQHLTDLHDEHGIPATGAIARTAANIKNGGRTPIAGMVHSVTLIIVLVVLMPYAGMIPMPTIAAILFIVAYNMCQWRTFRDLVKTAPKSDILVLIVTFVLTVIFDLVVAIEIGMVLACLLFIKRMSEETHADSWVYTDDDTPDIDEHLQKLPLQIRVYEITGPLFFGAADAIEHIVVKDFTRCLVLRMRGVPALDSTAMNALQNLVKTCESKGITLVFSHVNEQPMHVMEKAGFVELVGKENFQSNISAALKRAEEVI